MAPQVSRSKARRARAKAVKRNLWYGSGCGGPVTEARHGESFDVCLGMMQQVLTMNGFIVQWLTQHSSMQWSVPLHMQADAVFATVPTVSGSSPGDEGGVMSMGAEADSVEDVRAVVAGIVTDVAGVAEPGRRKADKIITSFFSRRWCRCFR